MRETRPGHHHVLAQVQVAEGHRPARAGHVVHVDAGLRRAEQLEAVQQARGGVPERPGAGVGARGTPRRRRGSSVTIAAARPGGLGRWRSAPPRRRRRPAASVTVASLPSSSAHSWPSGWACGGRDGRMPERPRAAHGRAAAPRPSGPAATSSRLRRLQTPRRSRLRSTSPSARAGSARASNEQHPAALGVGQRAHAVRGGLARERRGGLAAAAQDHQRDQARLGDQRAGRARGRPSARAGSRRASRPASASAGRDDLRR